MSFADIWGQEAAVMTLERALERGRVHHAYRFEGPPGVGKERTAFRLARALVCEVGGLGCGKCSACRRALQLSDEEPRVPIHPDVVLLGRGLYRSVTGQSEQQGIGVEQVRRVVLDRLGYSPHEGRALVFLVRDADEITVQAANALLKTLEEPPPLTHFILITSRPHRLLDTVRSRTLPLRFVPLAEDVLRRILGERGLPADSAPLAQGSADLALDLASEDSRREREAFGAALDAAISGADFAPAVRFAESQKGSRDALRADLSFFAQSLALRARALVGDSPEGAERWARGHAAVLAALRDLERNVQPALALESMLLALRDGAPAER